MLVSRVMVGGRYDFTPDRYEQELTAIIRELLSEPVLDADAIARAVKRHPKDGSKTFSKSEIIRGFRRFAPANGWSDRARGFIEKLRAKPVRTESGVAPVTVLTKPFPCPGECVFCPSDVRMPKSYLSMEPGAQRATQHGFDPYGQTFTRLLAFHNNGHRVDKIELIVLGGTWSSYPERYQTWFIKRCFDAMNDFAAHGGERPASEPRPSDAETPNFLDAEERIDGCAPQQTYNTVVSAHLRRYHGALLSDRESAGFDVLERAQRENEVSGCRNVGLVLETRPDALTEDEVIRLRRLGATKIQIGYQSLSDAVLRANKRGHDVAATRRAMKLLRRAGFKIHAHWMPNLLGSTPEQDVLDFARIFEDPDFRPDELKIYPCSLIESAELMQHYRSGAWAPYTHEALIGLLVECLARTPRWCRLTRIIRDIPSHDIVVGNKLTNLRELAEVAALERGIRSRDIRAREIRGRAASPDGLTLVETPYETSIGRDVFIELVTPEDRIVGFLRLTLPETPSFIPELEGRAIIREVHVYGAVVGIGEHDPAKAQHVGLGRRLIEHARRLSRAAGYDGLAVISAIGTRRYYADVGFEQGTLYQHDRHGKVTI